MATARRHRLRGPRRRAWSTPKTTCRPATYGGDFETTAIPRYDTGTPAPEHGAYGLLGDPEPLPYVQPGVRHSASPPVEPTEIEPDGGSRDHARLAGRRGTQDLGLMLLRVGLGALLIAHGLQKAFGWWGGSGLGGFQQSLADLGYQHANILTYVGAGARSAQERCWCSGCSLRWPPQPRSPT